MRHIPAKRTKTINYASNYRDRVLFLEVELHRNHIIIIWNIMKYKLSFSHNGVLMKLCLIEKYWENDYISLQSVYTTKWSDYQRLDIMLVIALGSSGNGHVLYVTHVSVSQPPSRIDILWYVWTK